MFSFFFLKKSKRLYTGRKYHRFRYKYSNRLKFDGKCKPTTNTFPTKEKQIGKTRIAKSCTLIIILKK